MGMSGRALGGEAFVRCTKLQIWSDHRQTKFPVDLAVPGKLDGP